jgi:hypothetical protein
MISTALLSIRTIKYAHRYYRIWPFHFSGAFDSILLFGGRCKTLIQVTNYLKIFFEIISVVCETHD